MTKTCIKPNFLPLHFVDGNIPSLDKICSTLSSVKIEQRKPEMEMKIDINGPSLVGEWFQIKVKLLNNETAQAENVTLTATLEEADDLIIADTTR